MKKPISYLLVLALFASVSLVPFSCTEKVDVKLQSATAILNVDAWINNKMTTQVIQLSFTQSYFDDSSPPPALGAVVKITDDQGKSYSFLESSKGDGRYTWTPSGAPFGIVGRTYTLTVNYKGETYSSTTKMSRTTKVDSITFKTEKGNGPNSKDLTRASFWANDSIGHGDCYWIRVYKNGSLLDLPSDINYAYDGGISSSGDFDGIEFLQPIREGINPEESNGDSPYVLADSIYVEIQSISFVAFDYLGELKTQTNKSGGIAELFSTPLANVSTNVINVNKNGSQVVGFFNVSSVSGLGKKFSK